MTIEEMKQRKQELGYTNEELSRISGVPQSTIEKIFGGSTKSPRKATIDALTNVLKKKYTYNSAVRKAPVPGELRETAFTYNRDIPDRDSAPVLQILPAKQGSYTIEDYYALPDDQRVELIDGVFYDMGAPAMIHQKILGDLYLLFRECVDSHNGSCEVYLSPCDVCLDRDNRTMVQPDLLVICHEYDLTARAVEGAPELVVEILSPSTRSKDMLLKLYKYQRASVREYWIVDPENRIVSVYDFRNEDFYPQKYDFKDTIPIAISGGECSIDFSRIDKRITRYYEAKSD